jgi:Domain of unknown function (DUF4382)
MKTNYFLSIAYLFALFIYSCKEKEIKTSPVQFYLIDSPTDFDSVNIHIKKIEANIVSDSTRWIPLQTKDTVANLFHLQDSLTLMIAQDIVPLGILKEIRFVLGDDNTVVVNGVSYPLQLADDNSQALMIQIGKRLNEVFNGFILDFDASQSIVAENGEYKLEPVVRLIQ